MAFFATEKSTAAFSADFSFFALFTSSPYNEFMKLFKMYINQLEAYLSQRVSLTDERQRKRLMYTIMVFTGLTVLLAIGLLSCLRGDRMLGFLDFLFALVLVTLLTAMGKAESPDRIIEATLILVLLFFLSLFLTSRAGGYSFVWFYTYPILSMFMLGGKKGSLYSLILISFSILPLSLSFEFLPDYPSTFLYRFVTSYLLATFLIFLYEKTREKMEKRLLITLEELKDQAIKDGLTGLYNRRYLDSIWAFLIRNFHDSEKYVTFIMMDLDYFKKYNDYYGHPMGDEVLKKIGLLLKKQIRRKTDYVFRYGGEEFCCLLYGCNRETSLTFSREILDELKKLDIPHERSPFQRVTLSMGIVMSSLRGGNNPSEIILEADKALYRAKDEGRNRFVFME